MFHEFIMTNNIYNHNLSVLRSIRVKIIFLFLILLELTSNSIFSERFFQKVSSSIIFV